MTEERLKEVLWDCTGMNADNHSSIIEAMKQAVNEALEEAAENAGTKLITNPCYYPGIGVDETTIEVVDKESILNLKVK